MLTALATNAADFAAQLPEQGALLGIDPGTRTLGIAASDPNRRIAAAVAALPRTRLAPLLGVIGRLIAERGVTGVVLGYPVNLDGSLGAHAQSTRAFGRQLRALGLPILLWDERFSTHAAARDVAHLGRARREALIDQVAATYILQGALDALPRPPAR